jgi:transcriptional regulator with XRE-family HTH domain
MQSSDLLVAGRKRAGLTQTQLAERMGRAQSTLARWETGHQHPPLESVIDALHACGLELTVGMARYDDSYETQITRQLRLDPSTRVRKLAPAWMTDGFDPLHVLERLAGRARFVVIGEVAGALNGWPLMLGKRMLEIVAAETALARIEQTARQMGAQDAMYDQAHTNCWSLLPAGGELHVGTTAPGTGGYRDLIADAQPMKLISGKSVQVASLLDLIRIAESSPDPDARTSVPALWATLDAQRRRQSKQTAR